MSSREFHRSQRVAEQMRRELSQLIRDEVDDPRLRLMTITEVRVSRDLGHSRVFFSLMDDTIDRDAVTQLLQSAAGFLRGRLGRSLVMRSVPTLNFEYDDSAQRGARMNELIASAVASDRRKAEEGE